MGLLDWLRRSPPEDAAPSTQFAPRDTLPADEGFYLGLAVQSHIIWRDRLREQVREQVRGGDLADLDPAIVGSDHQCPIGHWLYGAGRLRWARLDSYERLRRIHAEFHRVAEQIVREAARGRADAAQQLLRGPYVALSDQVQLDLVRLFADIEAASKKSDSGAPGEM